MDERARLGLGGPAGDFLLRWAEDEFVAGHLLGYRVGLYGPDLEENLALGSISQEEVAHARTVLGLAGVDGVEQDELLLGREPLAYRSTSLFDTLEPDDWAEFVVAFLVYELGEAVRLKALLGSPLETVRTTAALLQREEELHRAHWREWLGILAVGSDQSRARLQAAIARLVPAAHDFCEMWGADTTGATLGLALGRAEAEAQFRYEVEQVLGVHDLTVPWGQGEWHGRRGRHSPRFIALLEDAQATYRRYRAGVR